MVEAPHPPAGRLLRAQEATGGAKRAMEIVSTTSHRARPEPRGRT